MTAELTIIKPKWPAPARVQAITSTRLAGVSLPPFAGLNLAMHVGDDPACVTQNRHQLERALKIPPDIFWLAQQHTNRCVLWQTKGDRFELAPPVADASYSNSVNQPCCVMTADCLPILFCSQAGDWVAACHAGWRGLAAGVIQNTIDCYPGPANELMAWIGPAISQPHFEVGAEVRREFVALSAENRAFFQVNSAGRWQFDLAGLARVLMENRGLRVFGGDRCSFSESGFFYSYRRDGETGRMASLIWIQA